MATFKINDIEPNPFRHLESYPIRPEKVAALRASIASTSFWDNVVARPHPTQKGRAQIAYGHHRLEALRQEYASDPKHDVDLIIRDLDDATMIKIMANENMEDWESSALVTMETVKAVVLAYAEGQIKLRAPNNGHHVRKAPSFCLIEESEIAPNGAMLLYTADSISEFLGVGWRDERGKADHRIRYALAALELIEQEILTDQQFAGLNHGQARALVETTREARDRHAAIYDATIFDAEKHEKRLASNAANAEKEKQKAEADRIAAKTAEELAAAAKRVQDAETRQIIIQEEARLNRQRKKIAQTRKKEAKATSKGYAKAKSIGKSIAKHLKDGGSAKDARRLAHQIEFSNNTENKPPPDIEDFAKRTAGEISRAYTSRLEALDQLVKYREFISDLMRAELYAALARAGEIFSEYAEKMKAEPDIKTTTGEVIKPRQLKGR